jgi:hypothetical protein
MCRVNRSGTRIVIGLVVAGLLFACRSLYHNATQPTTQTDEATKTYSCPALPQTFKEADLAGIWVASYSLNDRDILTLKVDGTYKQIYDDPDAGQRYESDWQEWWIETRESGYLRLHLKGMRRCDGVTSICEREGGGIDPQLLWAIDYCENEVVEMPDEVILIVTGSKDDPPRGIILRQTRLAGSEWTWSFRLQEGNEKP